VKPKNIHVPVTLCQIDQFMGSIHAQPESYAIPNFIHFEGFITLGSSFYFL